MAGVAAITANRAAGGSNAARGGGAVATPQDDASQKALGGIFWWFLLGLMIMSDLASVLCTFLVTLGLGIAGAGAVTFVAAIAALPLGGAIALVGFLAGLFVTFNAYMFATGYFLFNHVPIMDARKLAMMGIGAIIEVVPVISVLPMLTLSFVAITIVENLRRGKGLLGGTVGTVVGKVANKTPIGRVASVVATKTPVGRIAGGATTTTVRLPSSATTRPAQPPPVQSARPRDERIRVGETGKEWLKKRSVDS